MDEFPVSTSEAASPYMISRSLNTGVEVCLPGWKWLT